MIWHSIYDLGVVLNTPTGFVKTHTEAVEARRGGGAQGARYPQKCTLIVKKTPFVEKLNIIVVKKNV